MPLPWDMPTSGPATTEELAMNQSPIPDLNIPMREGYGEGRTGDQFQYLNDILLRASYDPSSGVSSMAQRAMDRGPKPFDFSAPIMDRGAALGNPFGGTPSVTGALGADFPPVPMPPRPPAPKRPPMPAAPRTMARPRRGLKTWTEPGLPPRTEQTVDMTWTKKPAGFDLSALRILPTEPVGIGAGIPFDQLATGGFGPIESIRPAGQPSAGQPYSDLPVGIGFSLQELLGELRRNEPNYTLPELDLAGNISGTGRMLLPELDLRPGLSRRDIPNDYDYPDLPGVR